MSDARNESDAHRSLEASALERIAEHVAERGPRLIARSRLIYRVERASGAVALLALGLLAVRLTDAPRPCNGWEPPSMAHDGPAFELSGRIALLASRGASFRAVKLESCAIALALERGRVVVHAKDLGGGELSISTPEASVRVLGTLFSVERTNGSFRVEVAEGTVEVSSAGAREVLRHGEAVTRTASGRLERLVGLEVPDLRKELADGPPALAEAEPRPKAEARPSGAEARPSGAEARPSGARPAARSPRPKPGKARPPVAEPKQEVTSPPPTAEDLVRQAALSKQSGDLDSARALYRAAGSLPGSAAEAAWVALARLELSARRFRATFDALDERARRFPAGDLAVESAWIAVQAHTENHEPQRARAQAEALLRAWPDSVQGRAARAWLDEHPP
ncbi:MAG: FecR domain-containing protein [Deltaproteobacteria bacterium]|nr:FecR domain-containing protein [Deltaproteobacteria bacterium]